MNFSLQWILPRGDLYTGLTGQLFKSCRLNNSSEQEERWHRYSLFNHIKLHNTACSGHEELTQLFWHQTAAAYRHLIIISSSCSSISRRMRCAPWPWRGAAEPCRPCPQKVFSSRRWVSALIPARKGEILSHFVSCALGSWFIPKCNSLTLCCPHSHEINAN